MGTQYRAWLIAALLATSSAGVTQAPDRAPLRLDRSDYFEAPGVNWLVFSNVNEGLFADAKISGVRSPRSRSASSRLSVPAMLIAKSSRGSTMLVVTATCAARWNTTFASRAASAAPST